MKKLSAVSLFLLPWIICSAEKPSGDPLLDAARTGDVKSQLKLADEYFFGRNRRLVNPQLAAYWFRKAAEKNNARAQFNYGVCCLKGWGVKASPRMGYHWISRAADQKIPAAQIMQAEILFRGLAPENDPEHDFAQLSADVPRSLAILRTLADSGNAMAAKSLAGLLMSDVKLRREHAFEIRKMSSFAIRKMPMDISIVLLHSTILQNGIGGEANVTEAIGLLQRIVDVSPEAMARLSEAYEYGLSVECDRKKAFELCRLAAEKGSPRALVALGNRYLDGNMVKHDPVQAFFCFEKAEKMVYPPASSAVGKCFLDGIGTVQDKEKAFGAFWRGASAGDPESQYQLGVCLLNGTGTPSDHAGAVYWFKLASESGHSGAMRELGVSLVKGRGTKKDAPEGMALIRSAADSGDVKAIELLKKELTI